MSMRSNKNTFYSVVLLLTTSEDSHAFHRLIGVSPFEQTKVRPSPVRKVGVFHPHNFDRYNSATVTTKRKKNASEAENGNLVA